MQYIACYGRRMQVMPDTTCDSLTPRWKAARGCIERYVKATSEVLAETLWPTRCVICDTPGFLLCPNCAKRLMYLDWWQACPRCGAPYGRIQCTECNTIVMDALKRSNPPFDACASAVIYNDDAARTVRTWKDAGERRLANEMASLMTQVVVPAWWTEHPTVVAIPASRAAKRRRGFDHGDDLGHALAEHLELPVASVLMPPRTHDQRALTRKGRIGNLANSFYTIPDADIPPVVLLVDDVYTTGSTLFAASDALRAAGVQRIFCLTFARVL